jgi:beta-glucosidase
VIREVGSRCRRASRGPSRLFVVAFIAGLMVAPQALPASAARTRAGTHPIRSSGSCPWVARSRDNRVSPTALANEVLARMTLKQKSSFVVLRRATNGGSTNSGIASLCIPPLSLVDGPNGLADGLFGVTAYPAEIGIAASFDPALAHAEGEAEGDEARVKGISGLQSTDLNLARAPLGGRVFETYGEDPYLASVMGVANIEGVQSEGVMAIAKHFGAYTQETARKSLDQIVSRRTLAEIYDAPFRAAVERAHVASLMCALGETNGVNTCSNPALYTILRSWRFRGFIRSDLGAVAKEVSAFRAGLSLIKPSSSKRLDRLVTEGVLSASDLDRAVRAVLTQMFSHHLITRSDHTSLNYSALSPQHNGVALRAAEESIVLLKNTRSVLPLARRVRSVAVIGADANQRPVTQGGGSSHVIGSFLVKPLKALRLVLGPRVRVIYRVGSADSFHLIKIDDAGVLRGTQLHQLLETGAVVRARKVTPAIITATEPATGRGWAKWRLVFSARESGDYLITMEQRGDAWLYLNGHTVLCSRGLHVRADMSTSVALRRGHRYTLRARYFAANRNWTPRMRIVDVTPEINAAVRAARRAKVAIVFASEFSTEGADRSSLSLPGDENALISAVAAVNPNTVVVLNTGGAVTMPWLGRVAAVLEAWYPGQEDGTAIAKILTGAVNPSGRLPITFPTSTAAMPASPPRAFPGVDSKVHFGTGLDIGYRWYQAHHVTPLFPFGYGLDYTTFSLSNPSVTRTASGVDVRVTVTNTGTRAGADVVQVYVDDPPSAVEAPEQLRAFVRVTLAPAASRRVSMQIPWSEFSVFRGDQFTMLAGLYGIDIGSSSADLPLRINVHL